MYIGYRVYFKREYFHRDWTLAFHKELQVKVEKKQAKARNLQRFRKNKLNGGLFKQVNPGANNL